MTHESPGILAPVRAAAHGTPGPVDTPADSQTTADIAEAAPERELIARCVHEACHCAAANGSEWCSDACRDAQQGFSKAARCPCGHAPCAQQGGYA